jgi:hypothetical protein
VITKRDEVALELLKVILSTEIPSSTDAPGAFYPPKIAVDRASAMADEWLRRHPA